MKRSLILITLITIVSCSAKIKKIPTFVFDNEKILTNRQEKKLDSLLRKHEKETSNEIVIITTSNWEGQENALLFGTNFGNKLGIGKSEKDNGVIIVFSKNLRNTAISTGYGTEKILTDEIAKSIIDNIMIPKFKEKLYFEGLIEGSTEIVRVLELPENKIN